MFRLGFPIASVKGIPLPSVRLSTLRSAVHPHWKSRRSILYKTESEYPSFDSRHLGPSIEFTLCGTDARS